MTIYRRILNSIVKTALVALLLSISAIVTGCKPTAPDVIPISDPARRIEFEGFSILPPRAEGWVRLNLKELNQPKVIPNTRVRALLTVRAYFIKWLSGKPPSSSKLHRLTAVVRTLEVDDMKKEKVIGFLREVAEGFSGETFLDKCFEQDCMKYQSTSEVRSNFLISKQGFIVSHPISSSLFITIEFRQYYSKGIQPISAEALEIEVEPFQNSLEFSSTYAGYAANNSSVR